MPLNFKLDYENYANSHFTVAVKNLTKSEFFTIDVILPIFRPVRVTMTNVSKQIGGIIDKDYAFCINVIFEVIAVEFTGRYVKEKTKCHKKSK